MAALLTTCDVSTEVSRGKQPVAPALTAQQKENIEKTWKVVEEDFGLLDAGIVLFKHIFTIAPAAQQMFKSFKDVPFSELPENEDFCSHALQVTETISLAISSLDDLDSLVDVLKDLGGSHSSHGLQDAHFDVVGQALITTLSEGLGEAFTPEVKESYTTFYGLVTKRMKEGLGEAYSNRE